jgi:hypothetical protein
MCIEFATSINDYKFPDIPDKILSTFKSGMTNTMLFERVKRFPPAMVKPLIPNQTVWKLM